MASLKRVLVVVNKWWECDPVVNALLHEKARPKEKLRWPDQLHHPRKRPLQNALPAEEVIPLPWAVYAMGNAQVEIWCISDLLEHLPDNNAYQSSSERKVEQLPKLLFNQPPALVIAVGTAGYPSEVSINGGVTIGTNIFIHNYHPGGENPSSNWSGGPFDQVIKSSLPEEAFKAITHFNEQVTSRFIIPPNNAARSQIIAAHGNTAVGIVNVTDYSEYKKADEAALQAFTNLGAHSQYLQPVSLETTHGIIRVMLDAPFLFVSGITDRVGYFDQEVSRNEYAQNFAAAHNAGVAIAWMLPQISDLFK